MSRNGKPPAFQLYVNNWLGSANTRAMTPAQRGCYIDLLCYSWPDGIATALPLHRLLGMPESEWDEMKSIVLAQFTQLEDGRLVNLVLQEQYVNLQKYHQSQQDKANKRWGKTDSDGLPSIDTDMPGECHGIDSALPRECSLTATATASSIPVQFSSVPQETVTPEERKQIDSIVKEFNLHDPEMIGAVEWAVCISNFWPTKKITRRSLSTIQEQYAAYKAKQRMSAVPFSSVISAVAPAEDIETADSAAGKVFEVVED